MYQCSLGTQTASKGALYHKLSACCMFWIRICFGFFALVICVALSLTITIGLVSKV